MTVKMMLNSGSRARGIFLLLFKLGTDAYANKKMFTTT